MAQGGGAAPPSEAARKGMGRSLMVIIVVVVAALAFVAGIGVGNLLYAPPPAKMTLVVGTNVPFPPFESYNDTTGKFEGFDIDIAQYIASALNRQMQVRNFNDFGVLLTTVGNGGVDMAVSGITMSGTKGAERNATMAFSNPYYNANQAVVVKSSDTSSCPNNICTAQQLGNKTIGVQSATTSESWVDTYITPFDPNNATDIHRYSDVSTEITALQNGVYEYMIIDAGPAAAIVSGSSGALKLLGTIITNELYGIAVPHGDPDHILPTINTVLANLVSNGTYTVLITKWFGP